MTHPKDVPRPDGVSVTGRDERTTGEKTYDYIQFEAARTIADETVQDFKKRLQSNCPNWSVSLGGNLETGKLLIEAAREIQTNDKEVPDDVLNEMQEEAAEYYKEKFEQSR